MFSTVGHAPSSSPLSSAPYRARTSRTDDGSLLLTDTRAGTIGETIEYGYNSDLQVGSITYAGQDVHPRRVRACRPTFFLNLPLFLLVGSAKTKQAPQGAHDHT